METVEITEMTESKKERTINKPLLIAGILLGISWIFYVAYIAAVLPNAVIDWMITLTALDFFASLAMAVIVILASFKPSRIKFLVYPLLISAAVTIYSITSSIITYGFSALDLYYVFRNFTLAIGLILFAVYAIKKSIAIVFAAIFITISSVFGLWYNLEQLVYAFTYSAYLRTIFAYFLLVFQALGTLSLVWICCVLLPPQAKDKDIIKRDIVLNVILSVITLGVYAAFWVKSISEDIAKIESTEVNSSLETALFFIIPFFALYWLYEKGKKAARLANDADMSVLYVVQGVFLLCFFSLALIQNQIHKAVGLSE